MSRPLAVSRLEHIAQALDARGSVSVAALAPQLGVSRETIRRDIKALAAQGRANVVHGGAARRVPIEPSLATRVSANAAGKQAIGRRAASLVQDGMVVLIDSGSTTYSMGGALMAHANLTVITNSLPIATMLCRAPGVQVIMLGGQIDANDEAAFGVETIAALAHFRVDLVFLGVGGISQEGEFTDYSRLAAETRHTMMKAGQKVYILADHSKFGRSTPVLIPSVPHIAGLIVDAAPPATIARKAAARHWRVIVAKEQAA